MIFEFYGIDQTVVDNYPSSNLKTKLDGNTLLDVDFRETFVSLLRDFPALASGGTGGTGLPNGGTVGQILVKQSGVDGDALWENLVLTGGDANG